MRNASSRMKTLLFRGTVVLVLLFPDISTGFQLGNNHNGPSPHQVRVCQNKDCCRQWNLSQSLPETLQDLLPPDVQNQVQVQVSGCLSQCGQGPNLMIQRTREGGSSEGEVLLQGVHGPMALAQELQHYLGIRVPSKLLAAVTVMEKARKATTFEEKDRCLSSVIQVFQNDPLLRTSTANIRSHVLRAQVRLDYGMWEEALRDVSKALSFVEEQHQLGGNLVGRAWRTQADCYQALGRTEQAIEALQQWAQCDPTCRTKAMKEIQILKQNSALS